MPNKYAIALTIEIHDLMFSHYYFEKFGVSAVSKSFGTRMRLIDLHCFYSISIMFNRPMCWTPELAELQFCRFLQCVRYHFCISAASILVASEFSFSQNAVFCYEL